MRFVIPFLLLACTNESTLTAEEEILISAISGEEEVFTDHDIAARGMQPSSDMPQLFRTCDAQASFEEIFAQYDRDASDELDEEEAGQVCDERGSREAHHNRRAHHMMTLLKYVYDIDNDGLLSDEERETLYEDFSYRCTQIHQQLLQAYDGDGDGLLSEEERAQIREEAEHRREEGDRHSSGQKAEEGAHRDRRGGDHKGLPPFAREFDVDEDGVLSTEEHENLRETLREKIRSGEGFGKRCGEDE